MRKYFFFKKAQLRVSAILYSSFIVERVDKFSQHNCLYVRVRFCLDVLLCSQLLTLFVARARLCFGLVTSEYDVFGCVVSQR
jgi:hypothetical protein